MPMFEYILNKKGVIFDLDGTIADTEKIGNKALEVTARNVLKLDYLVPSNYARGYALEEKWGKILVDYNMEGLAKVSDLATKTHEVLSVLLKEPEFVEDLVVKPGFWQLLHELKFDKNFITALCTNSDRAPATEMMSFLGINNVFEFEVFGDDVKNKKPNPELFHKTAKLMGLKSSEIIVFEDSMAGIEAAYKANMECVVIRGREDTIELDKYPPNCVDFMYDFSSLPGNIGEDFRDFVVSEEDKDKIDLLFNELNKQVTGSKK